MSSSDFLDENSSHIENLMRHRFKFDVSRLLLLRQNLDFVTVVREEVDAAGIDHMLLHRRSTPQIQTRTLAKETTVNAFVIAETLSSTGGDCVVWMCHAPKNLEPNVYHLMGATGNALM